MVMQVRTAEINGEFVVDCTLDFEVQSRRRHRCLSPGGLFREPHDPRKVPTSTEKLWRKKINGLWRLKSGWRLFGGTTLY